LARKKEELESLEDMRKDLNRRHNKWARDVEYSISVLGAQNSDWTEAIDLLAASRRKVHDAAEDARQRTASQEREGEFKRPLNSSTPHPAPNQASTPASMLNKFHLGTAGGPPLSPASSSGAQRGSSSPDYAPSDDLDSDPDSRMEEDDGNRTPRARESARFLRPLLPASAKDSSMSGSDDDYEMQEVIEQSLLEQTKTMTQARQNLGLEPRRDAPPPP
jgi:hypothetical protein